MLSQQAIRDLAKKFQTRENNVVREYIQHLSLAFLYQQKEAENLLFKGGTALKMIYQSPRFSEDLDFSLKNFSNKKRIESLFIESLTKISQENIKVELREAKFTSGGYLGIIFYSFYDFKGEIFFEVSLRKKKLEKEITTIISNYLSPYIIVHLSPKEIVQEKILALLERGKPRDYYDLYFILRHPLLRKFLSKEILKKVNENLLKKEINFKKELSMLLPISHHQILKNFKNNFLTEIRRF